LTSFFIFFVAISTVSSIDTELENMRQENIETHDVSIFVEKKIEYIHSRISLKPLISSLEHGLKLSNMFGMRANSTLGKILSNKVNKMVAKAEKR